MITAIVILFFGLEVHGALTSGNAAAQRSVHELFAGSVAVYFYGGTLLLGLAVPAWLVWTGLSGPLSLAAMVVLALASALRGLLHEVLHHPRRGLPAGVDTPRPAAIAACEKACETGEVPWPVR